MKHENLICKQISGRSLRQMIRINVLFPKILYLYKRRSKLDHIMMILISNLILGSEIIVTSSRCQSIISTGLNIALLPICVNSISRRLANTNTHTHIYTRTQDSTLIYFGYTLNNFDNFYFYEYTCKFCKLLQ